MPDELQFNADGLATFHNSEFLRDPRFRRAYRFGLRTTATREHAHIGHLGGADDAVGLQLVGVDGAGETHVGVSTVIGHS